MENEREREIDRPRVVPKKFEHYFQPIKCTLVLADSISVFIFALALVEFFAWPLLGLKNGSFTLVKVKK